MNLSKENINYKPINGRLAEHFGFGVNSDGKLIMWRPCVVYIVINRHKITALSVKPCRD